MLLGIAEVPDPRAQGQPEHPRMSLHPARRDGHSDSAGVAGDARILPVEAGLSNLQRLCHVAVQEARTGLRSTGVIKWKHAMHLIRLLMAGVRVLKEGFVPVDVGDQRD